MPLPSTFPSTDTLLHRYLKIKETTLERRIRDGITAGDTLWKDLYGTMKTFATTWKTSRILNGLPDEETNLVELMEKGGSSQKDYQRSTRDISWLEEYGQCMENIRPGNSTNIHAGRGAFANRFIPQGGLVAPAPLIHVADYGAMKVYETMENPKIRKSYIPNRSQGGNYQLFLNYCFGHAESTLVLCPYGLLTAYINHSPDRPNARILWSKEMRHSDWREKPIKKWASEKHTGLQFDFIALRDIEEGEEIFIDYGPAWEEAWQRHVQNYQPRNPNYIPAFELNEMIDMEYRTGKDDDLEYVVDGVRLMCRRLYIQQFIPFSDIEDDVECTILQKRTNGRYVVQLKSTKFFGQPDYEYTDVRRGKILWDVPSDAFYFVDLPYTRDHYMPNAFRHAMMIPDDLFPTIWKNKKPNKKEDEEGSSFFSRWF